MFSLKFTIFYITMIGLQIWLPKVLTYGDVNCVSTVVLLSTTADLQLISIYARD